MDGEDGFYVYLPSDSSAQMFRNNTRSHFTTYLTQEVNLDGQWECGLKEIHYSSQWPNIRYQDTLVGFHTPVREGVAKTWLRRYINSGYYDTYQSIALEITGALQPVRSALRWEPVEKRFILSVAEGAGVTLRPGLCRILGFGTDTEVFSGGHHKAPYQGDLTRGMEGLYVYLDITRPTYVGDTRAPLLQVVPADSKCEGMCHKEYVKPVYIPLCKNNFRTIDVDIRDGTGEHVPFSTGRTTLLLHFRRSKQA